MQSFFAVKNETVFPVISVYIDGNCVFSDILRGEISEYAQIECGSATLTVYNNFEKLILDRWISIPPNKKLVLTICDKYLKVT